MTYREIPQEDQAHVDFMVDLGYTPGTTSEQLRAYELMEATSGVLPKWKVTLPGNDGDLVLDVDTYYKVDYDGNTTYVTQEEAATLIEENE